jgi:hypothetical protein
MQGEHLDLDSPKHEFSTGFLFGDMCPLWDSGHSVTASCVLNSLIFQLSSPGQDGKEGSLYLSHSIIYIFVINLYV